MKKSVNIVRLFWKAFRAADVGNRLEKLKRQLAIWLNQHCNGCERRTLKIGLVGVFTLISAYLLWVILTAFD